MGQEEGAITAVVDPTEIEVRESVRLKCLIPLCEYYGVCKVCPPYLPSLEFVRAALQFYHTGLLVALKYPLATQEELQRFRTDFEPELKLLRLVHRLEKMAQDEGFREAISLAVGGCKLCPECTPPGTACRHPYEARPSPEGLGIDVTGLAIKSGIIVQWPPKDQVVLVGLVLF